MALKKTRKFNQDINNIDLESTSLEQLQKLRDDSNKDEIEDLIKRKKALEILDKFEKNLQEGKMIGIYRWKWNFKNGIQNDF